VKKTTIVSILVLLVASSAVFAVSDAGQYENTENPVIETSFNPEELPIPGYLIIYAHDFRPEVCPELDSFIQWKLRKGLNVYAVDQNDLTIMGTTSDVDVVKGCIQWWYNSAYCNPAAPANYVLLVGDAPPWNPALDTPYCYLECQKADDSHIPIYVGWSFYDLSSYLPEPKHDGRNLSDFYYQLLEGNDLIPDVCLGRWCPRDSSDLATYVKKNLSFEKPFSDPLITYEWDCEEVLFVAAREDGEGFCYIECKQEIENVLPLNVVDDLERLYEIRQNDLHSYDVVEQIEEDTGVGIINYRGHGTWYMWGGIHFDTSDIKALNNNNRYPLVYNICCSNGCITASTSETYPVEIQIMVEAWTRSPNGGAVASLGATRKTWPDENDLFDYEIFRSHYQDTFNCGQAINAGKVSMLTSPGMDSARADENVKSYLWIGDPELDIWRSQPVESYFEFKPNPEQLEIMVWQFSPHIQRPGTKVCLYREGGGYHRLVQTGNFGRAYFPYPSLTGTYHLTATNQRIDHNIIPACTTFTWTGSWPPIVPPGSKEAVEELPEVAVWQLEVISPNPVRSQGVISYSVGGTASVDISLTVYDASGREVKLLASGEHSPGHHQINWDCTDASGAKLSAGVYFVRMQSSIFTASQRMVLIR